MLFIVKYFKMNIYLDVYNKKKYLCVMKKNKKYYNNQVYIKN